MSKLNAAIPEFTDEQIRDYQYREAMRLDDGTYTRLPEAWRATRWFKHGITPAEWSDRYYGKGEHVPYCDAFVHHYAHVSLTDGAMIAFTENHAKGVADRQTKMKAGKYLKKYYGSALTDAEIRDMATAFSAEYAPMDLKFAITADAIENAYVNGPRSCMAHGACEFSSSIHPVRVYAGPDLQVAYIAHSEEDIRARAVVWPAKKIFSTIYGDASRLKPLLEAQGYKPGALRGARLRAVHDGSAYVVPYVDCSHYACDETEDGYLVIGSGHVHLKETCGLSDQARYTCTFCDCRLHDDNTYSCDDIEGVMCESCNDENTVYCERSGYTIARDNAVEMANGDYWHERQFRRHGFTCPINDTNHPDTEGVEMADGDVWSQDAFDAGGFICHGNGGNYSRAVMVVMADGALWSQDHFADHGHVDNAGANQRNADAPADAVKYRCPDTQEMTLLPPAPVAAPTIRVGDWVECLEACDGEFTIGKLYQVTRRFNEGATARISVAADDKGDPNGWRADCFRPAPAYPNVIAQGVRDITAVSMSDAMREQMLLMSREMDRSMMDAMLYGALETPFRALNEQAGV